MSELIRGAQLEAEALTARGSGHISLGLGFGRWLESHDSPSGYQLIREIHRGGQGVVYQALQKSTQRKVAIKVMREAAFAESGDQHRFEREVRILAQLNHPHIVAVHDSGTAAGCHYYVMDYIPGQPLDAYLARERPSVRVTLDLFLKVAEAVNAAHLRGVIHRDLKPSNIRIDEAGRPYVLDFGLAKVVADDSDAERRQMTMTGQFVGSVPWASPEQAEGASAKIDTRTDVYSLGVVLFQMLTSRLPYQVNGPIRDVLDRIIRDDPLRPSTLRRDIDDEVETIVLKCLQKERERRYQTAGELAQDIRRYLANEPIEAKRDSTWYVLRKTLRRRRGTVIAASLVFLSMLAAIVGTTTFAVREAQQRALAERRAVETNRVVDFQAQMLAGIQVEPMGARLRDDMIDQAEQGWHQANISEAEIAERRAAMEAILADVSFITTAQRSLDRDVFESALVKVQTEFADQPLLKARLLQILATALRNLDLPKRAEPPQTEALEIYRRMLGPDDLFTLTSLHEMAALDAALDRYDEAEPYARAALEGRRRTLGEDNPETIDSIWVLGSILQRQGHYEEAEQYLRAALAGRQRVLGESSPEAIAALSRLAQLLLFDGRYLESEEFVCQVIDARRAANDEVGANRVLNLIAHIRYLQGRFDEARSIWEERLDQELRWRSEDSREVLFIRRKLGWLLMDQGLWEEAEPHLRKSLDGALRTMWANHPFVVYGHIAMARLRLGQGRLDEEEPHICEGLAGYCQVATDISPDARTVAKGFVDLLQQTGRLDEAESICRQRVEACLAKFGPEDKYTREAVDMLETVLASNTPPPARSK